MDKNPGIVYFIGAGPGDRGLITVKGKRLLAKADVILYDNLIHQGLLDVCRTDAEKICVGKRGGDPSLTQEEINTLLLEKARQGNLVARLKGGDPFLFGRGGEEAQLLFRNGILFRVIPGVPSGTAVPAYAGIPVTDRRVASSVAFITGHEAYQKEKNLLWQDIARGADTLVFLMGMRTLSMIVEQLIHNGRSPETPAAVIQRGTLGTQRVAVATLDGICQLVQQQALKPPGIVVVGDVVALRKELLWYEHLPLFGRIVLITRNDQPEEPLSEILEENGAEVFTFPVISITQPDSFGEADEAISQLDSFQWIIFTSANGVRYFMQRLWHIGRDVRCIGNHHIAAIGRGTAAALHQHCIKPDLVPEEFRAEGLVEAFREKQVCGQRILVPRAQEARPALEQGLKTLGNEVCIAPVYKTIAPLVQGIDRKLDALRAGDCIVFTSSSTVHNFFAMVSSTFIQEFKDMIAACIGPITAGALRKRGFTPHIVPESYDLPSLAGAIIAYYKKLNIHSREQ